MLLKGFSDAMIGVFAGTLVLTAFGTVTALAGF